MDILVLLIPVSLGLGTLGLLAFLWTLKSRQYEDPAGDAARILNDTYDRSPPSFRPDRPIRNVGTDRQDAADQT